MCRYMWGIDETEYLIIGGVGSCGRGVWNLAKRDE